ncbi:ROK family protein [Chloroflexales bacterium ZM16-3]|nr:ROK family protein [Chloroflexales bacterium ZM16-3]
MGNVPPVYIGTDFGATTSKIAGVWADGTPISTEMHQRPSDSQLGPDAVVSGWITSISTYLEQNGLAWEAVQGVGVAIPGPRRSYGVLERGPNLPESFVGFDVYTAYSQALAARAGRAIPLAVGNDGNMGGLAEAHRVRGASGGGVLLLAPGSGLGCAYIDQGGMPLDGDTLAGMEASHMPAPLHLLGARAYPCGCGRDWGCIEIYTSLAGLPYLLAERLAARPDHPLANSPLSPKERALALRGLAQQGDDLAAELFDFQARALGLHVASLAMALDPKYVIIGGGLMDPESTTDSFREHYLGAIWAAASPHLWPAQRESMRVVPATLGDLSQAIGAALMALYKPRAT